MSNFSDKLKELREHKVLGISIVDTAGTIAIGWSISKILDTDPLTTILLTFVAGEMVHFAFEIETPVTRFIKQVQKNADVEYM